MLSARLLRRLTDVLAPWSARRTPGCRDRCRTPPARTDASDLLGLERGAREQRHRRAAVAEPDRQLLERHVDLVVRRLADEAIVAHMADDADHLAPDRLRQRSVRAGELECDALADRIRVRKELLRAAPLRRRPPSRGPARIAIGERAAPQHRRSPSRGSTRASPSGTGWRSPLLAATSAAAALRSEPPTRCRLPASGSALLRPTASRPAMAPARATQLTVERGPARGIAVARVRQRRAHRHHARRIETELDCGQLGEASDGEAGADQQHQRERHLGDDQHRAGARAGAARRARRVLERGEQIDRRRRSAGARPNATPVTIDTTSAKARTRRSTATRSMRGTIVGRSPRTRQHPTTRRASRARRRRAPSAGFR